MTALTNQDVFRLMTEINASYQPASGECVATPKRMRHLLDRISQYTDEVQAARKQYKTLAVAIIPGMSTVAEVFGGSDVSVPQWRADMSNWQYRLAEYYRSLDKVPSNQEDTVEGCKAIYESVTAPLLDGIYYEIMPGIVLNNDEKARILAGEGHPEDDVRGDHEGGHSNRKPPDVVTPFSLGNQIKVYQDFQKENLERLIHDLTHPKIFNPSEWPWWLQGLAIAGTGVVLGIAGLYVYNLLPKPAPKANPPRRRSSIGGRKRKLANTHLPEGWRKRSNVQRIALAKELDASASALESKRKNGVPSQEEQGLRYAATVVSESLPPGTVMTNTQGAR